MATLGGSEFEIESRQSDAGKIDQLVSSVQFLFFFCINYVDLAMNDSDTVAIQSEEKYGYVYLFSAMPTRIN